MANEAQLRRLLTERTAAWNAWRTAELTDIPDPQDADLQRGDLVGVNLFGANLQDAYLYQAKLYHADLQDANLIGALLQGGVPVPSQFAGG